MKKHQGHSLLFSMSRDIIIIFLVCVSLVGMAYFGREREKLPLAFGGFYGEHGKPNPPKTQPAEKTFERKFQWNYPKEKKRETVFLIPGGPLKKEIKAFGIPRSPEVHPFFLEKRGFNVVGQKHYLGKPVSGAPPISIFIDYQEIYQRNLKYFGGFTEVLKASAEIAPGKDPMPSFLAFVQHIRYQLPPRYYRGKFINSFFVPLVCLYEQYGDCDSKSMLLAEFLGAYPLAGGEPGAGEKGEKLALVLVRGSGLSHALLAVKRTPLPGMTSLHDFRKGYYIVLETTSPEWSPGFIHQRVTDALKSGYFLFLELN